MATLLATLSLEQIILFLVLIGVGIKEVFELISYFKNKIKNFLHHEEMDEEQNIELGKINQELKLLQSTLSTLVESDKNAIKSWIVMMYKKCKKDPFELDSMEMDLLERRYATYHQEGGNSYIEQLMDELRKMYSIKEINNVSN